MSGSYVADLVQRAREAFKEYEFVDQERVDYICARVAWAGCRESFAREIAELTFEQTGIGNVEAKYLKMRNKVKAIYADMKDSRTVDVVNVDEDEGLIEIAKPVGVVGALIPVTNPEMTPFIKALWTLKTRNAIVLAPHPRSLATNNLAVREIRSVLKRYGYPEDLVIGVEETSVDNSKELMSRVDLILATGGAGMVKAAYSSGKPAYGVGTGNAVLIVDETVDVADSAAKIKASKTFDNASGCSADNSCLASTEIYDDLVRAMTAVGGYLVRNGSDEKKRLQAVMWSGHNVLSREIVAQSAVKIARLAEIPVPESTEFLVVEEDGIGDDFPFSREKLSPVLTLYRWRDFDRAVEMANEITGNCGAGHSCAIHTRERTRAEQLGRRARVARVTVNQAHALSNSGAWHNGLMNTGTLGCGTWGGNIVSENVYHKHLLNTTRVAFPVDRVAPSDEVVFGTDVIGEFA